MTTTVTLDSTIVPLQLAGLEQQLSEVIGGILAFLPVLLSAIVILVVGYIVGRLLGTIVTRILDGIGLNKYTRGTPLERAGGGRGEGSGIGAALGKVVEYYVYFIAVLAAADVLQIPVLSRLLSRLGAFIPLVISALVVLVIGFVVGRVVSDIIADLIGGFDTGRYLRDTPLHRFADQEGEFGTIVGKLVAYYIYFLTILTAANVLQIAVLSRLLSRFAGYIPALVGGVAVLIAGVLVAEFVGNLVADTDRRRITDVLGVGVKVFIYYMTATLALDTIGFDTAVLNNLFNVFVVALFGSLGLAVAIGLGIAIGYGTRDYVADNVDQWTTRASGSLPEGESGNTGTRSDD